MADPARGRLRRELALALLLKLLALWALARLLPPRVTADQAAAGLVAQVVAVAPPASSAARGLRLKETP